MTSDEKLALIQRIMDRQAENQNDDDGDRHLADAYLAIEAIDAIINDVTGNPIVRMYTQEGRETSS
jgi:hypothetical protein